MVNRVKSPKIDAPDAKRVFVVIGYTREFSDYHQWAVAAYANEVEAQRRVSLADR